VTISNANISTATIKNAKLESVDMDKLTINGTVYTIANYKEASGTGSYYVLQGAYGSYGGSKWRFLTSLDDISMTEGSGSVSYGYYTYQLKERDDGTLYLSPTWHSKTATVSISGSSVSIGGGPNWSVATTL
jgi:uncharacterized protein YjbI with pentapeptide repeats